MKRPVHIIWENIDFDKTIEANERKYQVLEQAKSINDFEVQLLLKQFGGDPQFFLVYLYTGFSKN